VIWEPFVLALVLGIIVSAGLYFAYLWPSVEPVDDEPAAAAASDAAKPPDAATTDGAAEPPEATTGGAPSPAP
jgi:hypothetical protein